MLMIFWTQRPLASGEIDAQSTAAAQDFDREIGAAAVQRHYGRSAPRTADPRARQAVTRGADQSFEVVDSGRGSTLPTEVQVAVAPGALDPKRLAILAENQKKCAAIVRALRELLREKGLPLP